MRVVRTKSPCGFVLFFALIILVVLTLLSLFFILSSSEEERTSQNWKYKLQANFAAESALEKAVVMLRQKLLQNPFLVFPDPTLFPGEDAKDPREILGPGKEISKNRRGEASSISLEQSTLSSFPAYQMKVGGRMEDVFLQMPGSQLDVQTICRAKIVDLSGALPMADDNEGGHPLMLNNLSRFLELPRSWGNELETQRSQQVGAADSLLLRGLLQSAEPGIKESIESFLNLYPSPSFAVLRPLYSFSAGGRSSTAPLSLPRRAGSLIHLKLELYPKLIFKGRDNLERRSPVNVNTAPLPVLVSVLAHLKGVYLAPFPYTYNLFSNPDRWGEVRLPDELLQLGSLKEVTLSWDQARHLAEVLIKERVQRRGFKTWPEFSEFLSQPETGLTPLEKDLVLANANPNSDLNHFNPNASFFRAVDKLSLEKYTTEFTFYPTGVFSIETLSQVLWKGRPMASTQIKSVVQLYDLERQTTQRDFSEGTISTHALPSLYTYHHQTLALYPEPPLFDLPKNFFYDGQIMRASVDLRPNDTDYMYSFFQDYPKLKPLLDFFIYPDGLYMEQLMYFRFENLPKFLLETLFEGLTSSGSSPGLPGSSGGGSPSPGGGTSPVCSPFQPARPAYGYHFSGSFSFWVKPFMDWSIQRKPRLFFRVVDPSMDQDEGFRYRRLHLDRESPFLALVSIPNPALPEQKRRVAGVHPASRSSSLFSTFPVIFFGEIPFGLEYYQIPPMPPTSYFPDFSPHEWSFLNFEWTMGLCGKSPGEEESAVGPQQSGVREQGSEKSRSPEVQKYERGEGEGTICTPKMEMKLNGIPLLSGTQLSLFRPGTPEQLKQGNAWKTPTLVSSFFDPGHLVTNLSVNGYNPVWNTPFEGTLGSFYMGVPFSYAHYPPPRYFPLEGVYTSKRFEPDPARGQQLAWIFLTTYAEDPQTPLRLELQTEGGGKKTAGSGKAAKGPFLLSEGNGIQRLQAEGPSGARSSFSTQTFRLDDNFLTNSFQYRLVFPPRNPSLTDTEVVDDVTLLYVTRLHFLMYTEQ